MNTVPLHDSSGATALIHHHGAHVTSWKTAEGIERLFLSERTDFSANAAIRGGVPIIFPQFAALGPLPKHGFARTSEWQFDASQSIDNLAVFTLSQSTQTLAAWPFRFLASYRVLLQPNELRLQLMIRNDDVKDLSFTAALHTYLRVNDIDKVSVHGLQGLRCRDSANGNTEFVESNEAIHFAGEVDRIYMNSSSLILMNDSLHSMRCSAQGFTDTVIWNPGAVLSKKLADMDDDGYRHMVCIEAAVIESPITLAPNDSWQGIQTLVANS